MTRIATQAAISDQELADLVENYAVIRAVSTTGWLTRLKLDSPRKDIRSLGLGMRFAKRMTDIVGASCLLLLTAPLMLLVTALIKLTSPGPVIFRQTRTGLNLRQGREQRRASKRGSAASAAGSRRAGSDRRTRAAYGKPFVMYKFRTMRTDAERGGAQFARPNDPRVIPLGRFLRKSRIDELPQLWNVLRGEMSLIGPRPERPEFIEQLSAEIPDYLQRLGLKPGLTGLAQVVNGYDNDLAGFRRKVAFDLLYLQNCCLRNDLKILLRTVGVVLTGKGAL